MRWLRIVSLILSVLAVVAMVSSFAEFIPQPKGLPTLTPTFPPRQEQVSQATVYFDAIRLRLLGGMHNFHLG